MLLGGGLRCQNLIMNHNLTAYIKSDKSNEEVESKIE